MLTYIRKFQKIVLIFVTVVICIAFAWLYNRYEPADAASKMVVDGKAYRIPDALRIANLFNVARYDLGAGASFFQPSPLGEFAASLSGNSQDRTGFVANLIILRNEAKRLGIEAAPEAIQDVIRSLPKFTNPTTNQFDPTFYDNYIKNELGRYSMTATDLYELVGDYVKYRELQALVAAGHRPTAWEIDQIYESQYETFATHQIVLKRSDFSTDIEISEEAVETYYEENRDSLFSEPKRAIGYVTFPKEAKKEEETEEAFEERRNAKAREFNETYKEITAKMDSEGMTFEEAIESIGDRAKKTEPFSQDDPPAELEGLTDLVAGIFTADPEAEGADKLLAADDETAITMYWIDEQVDRIQLTLEEARPQVTENLRQQEINERLMAAAEEAKTKILANLKGETDFPAAAKAAGFEVVSPKPFGRTETPEGTDYATNLAQVAFEMEAGEFSAPEMLDDGVLLVYVSERTLPQRETEPEDRQRIADSMAAFVSQQAYRSWFNARVEAAKPTPPMIQGADGELEPVSLEQFAR